MFPTAFESIDEKFIHKAMNALAIALGNSEIIIRKLTKEPPMITIEEIPVVMRDVIEQLEKIEVLLSDKRDEILKIKKEIK